MALINQQGQAITDTWTVLTELDALQVGGRYIVELSLWQAERERLLQQSSAVGLVLDNTVDVVSLSSELEHFNLIVLRFPKFTDGRAYSQARRLRTQLAYQGELRAQGDVLRDQLLLMVRCGFDSFELRADQDIQACTPAFTEISVTYQP